MLRRPRSISTTSEGKIYFWLGAATTLDVRHRNPTFRNRPCSHLATIAILCCCELIFQHCPRQALTLPPPAVAGNHNLVTHRLLFHLTSTHAVTPPTPARRYVGSGSPAQALTTLRTVERLFVQVCRRPAPVLSPADGGRAGLEELAEIIDCIPGWADAVAQRRALLGASPSAPVTFRVSCRLSGAKNRSFGVEQLAATIGAGLRSQLGWRVQLRSPEIEVSVHLSDTELVIGLPLTDKPLADRPYIAARGMRPTVAWAMCWIADISDGFTVHDPTCGAAILLVEGARTWRAARFTGADKAPTDAASRNLIQAKVEERVEVTPGIDLTLALTGGTATVDMVAELHEGKVDRIVCDPPFGLQHSDLEAVKELYPQLLAYCHRLLRRPGGRAVLLVRDVGLVQRSCMVTGLFSKPIFPPPPPKKH